LAFFIFLFPSGIMLKQPSLWIGGDFVTDDEFFRRNEVRATQYTQIEIKHRKCFFVLCIDL